MKKIFSIFLKPIIKLGNKLGIAEVAIKFGLEQLGGVVGLIAIELFDLAIDVIDGKKNKKPISSKDQAKTLEKILIKFGVKTADDDEIEETIKKGLAVIGQTFEFKVFLDMKSKDYVLLSKEFLKLLRSYLEFGDTIPPLLEA